LDRAKSASEFREALRPWFVPTFSVVFADTAGHIGFHAAGAIPLRNLWERGYRPGWDPRHQWEGLIPFEGMPQWADPRRGWIATANNRPAPEDFPYPLSGAWSNGLRAERIRQLIETRERLTRADFVAMQHDALSLRARRCLPHLLKVLKSSSRPPLVEAVRHLETWDYRMEVDRVGATLFDVFFAQWTKAVVRQRFDGETAALLTDGAAGLAAALLAEDAGGWFPPGQREPAILAEMESALAWLAERFGASMEEWSWGRLHVLLLRHFLSGRGNLGELLDRVPQPVAGDYTTVCNSGSDAGFAARAGAGYRLLVELSATPSGLWAVDVQSQSGHPGSTHYGDQVTDWSEGRYHFLPLDGAAALRMAVNHLVLEPLA
jgi:penicillin amidase